MKKYEYERNNQYTITFNEKIKMIKKLKIVNINFELKKELKNKLKSIVNYYMLNKKIDERDRTIDETIGLKVYSGDVLVELKLSPIDEINNYSDYTIITDFVNYDYYGYTPFIKKIRDEIIEKYEVILMRKNRKDLILLVQEKK